MNKRNLTKTIVRNANGFVVGSATKSVLRTHVAPSNNAALNLLIDASLIIGGMSVSGTVMEPVSAHTDRKVDAMFDWFDTTFKKN